MSSRKKFSPSDTDPANALTSTSRSTQQLPPRQLPSPAESQSHFQQQQQQQPRPVCPSWSERQPNLLPPTFLNTKAPPSVLSPSPFPRYGHALSATATAAGDLFLFGGVIAHHSLCNDLYVFSTRGLTATLLQTNGEVPSPRVRLAGAHIDNALLIWGGATNTDDKGVFIGPYDDSLYLLNLVSRKWTRVVVNGPGPEGRYCHAVTMVGSKFFVFGGVIDGKFLNDMWEFDLNSLKSNPVWDSHGSAIGDKKPPPRANHVLVTIGDRIVLFGGADGRNRFNDTWTYDVSTRKWTELQCTGCIPSPRDSHAATLVDDVMYVSGGRVDGAGMDDLLAFKLSTQQWFIFQNTGPTPRRKYHHAMASDGTRVFVLGGKLPSTIKGDETVLANIHVLDTKHIFANPDPNAVKPSEKTTKHQARKSSSGPPIQEQPQHSTSSSSDAHAASGASFQKATPKEVVRIAIPSERIPGSNDLPLQPMSANSKLSHVSEGVGGGEGSAEYRTQFAVRTAAAQAPHRTDAVQLLQKRRQSTTPSAQTERDQRIAQLTDELALKNTLLEQAQAKAAEATKRAELESREHADRLLAQTSLLEQKDAELVNLRARLDALDESPLSRNQHVRALEQQNETKFAEVLAELEARESELEAVRLRLTDAENGWAKSKTEADTLRAMTTAGFVNTDETRRLKERVWAMEAEMALLRSSEKGSQEIPSRNED